MSRARRRLPGVRRGGVVVAFAAFVFMGGATAAAEPDPLPPGDAPPVASSPNKRQIQPAYEKVLASPEPAVEELLPALSEAIFVDGYDQGLVGIQTDYDHPSITVRWLNEPPDLATRIMRAADSGIQVIHEVVSGRSRQGLDEAVAALNAEASRSHILTRLGVVGIDASDDNSQLTFKVAGHEPISPEDEALLAQITGLSEIGFRYGQSEAVTYASRQDDAAPWRGGARIQTVLGSCTSGFAVLTSGGAGRLLSARHCDPTGDGAIKDGAGTTIAPGGSSVSVVGSIDSMLIDPTVSPATSALIYRGSYTSSTYSTVKNWYSNWPNDAVCSSGSSTGELCGSV